MLCEKQELHTANQVSLLQSKRHAQPFAPALFRQGRLELAHSFLEVQATHSAFLRGEGPAVDLEALGKRLEAIEETTASRKTKLVHQKWRCNLCRRELG